MVALLLGSCQQSKVTISGRLIGTNAQSVRLEQFAPTKEALIDSVQLQEDGAYLLTLDQATREPELYTLHCGNDRIPLLLQAGDRVEVNAIGNITHNYTLSGSEESELLREFYQQYAAGIQELDRLSGIYARASKEHQAAAQAAYTEEFRRIKREQLRFVVAHKNSLAALYALYQRLPGDPYLFNAESDIIYYRTVADGLRESYPESRYLTILENDIARMEMQQELLSNVREITYPDLELNDMFGQTHRLSELAGKVILLDFWSATAGNSNALNAELKEIYARYHEAGLEIYQVAIDRSKPRWINAVQEQSLPWISVSDLQGESSLACRLYQIEKLPSNFLFDREGNIVGRDLYGAHLEQALQELL